MPIQCLSNRAKPIQHLSILALLINNPSSTYPYQHCSSETHPKPIRQKSVTYPSPIRNPSNSHRTHPTPIRHLSNTYPTPTRMIRSEQFQATSVTVAFAVDDSSQHYRQQCKLSCVAVKFALDLRSQTPKGNLGNIALLRSFDSPIAR